MKAKKLQKAQRVKVCITDTYQPEGEIIAVFKTTVGVRIDGATSPTLCSKDEIITL